MVAGPLEFRGMEYAGLIELGFQLYREHANEMENRVAHEVAHQWWYNMVGNDAVNAPWLDEGLAEFSTYFYVQRVNGQRFADRLAQRRWLAAYELTRQRGLDAVVDQPVGAFVDSNYETIVYAKAALFHHALLGGSGRRDIPGAAAYLCRALPFPRGDTGRLSGPGRRAGRPAGRADLPALDHASRRAGRGYDRTVAQPSGSGFRPAHPLPSQSSPDGCVTSPARLAHGIERGEIMDTNFDATSLAGHDLWAAPLAGDTVETAPPVFSQDRAGSSRLGRQAGRLGLPVETRALWVNRWEFSTPDDIRRLADKAAAANFNALFFQVRGNADACYRSDLEPWMARLSGGVLGDDPGWDPLAVAVEEAHARGLELHAWVNVYPAWLGETPPPPAEPEPMFDRFNRLHGDQWLVWDRQQQPMQLNSNYLWSNPGHLAVQDHIAAVGYDIVSRYYVDGLHLDYVRYPGWEYSRDPLTLEAVAQAQALEPRAGPQGVAASPGQPTGWPPATTASSASSRA